MDYEGIFSDSQTLLETIQKADKLTIKTHGNTVSLERAIILSWWCDKGNCSFCFMSTQKERIKDRSKARRRISNVLAEAVLLKRMNWKITFISGGYGAYSINEMSEISSKINAITSEPNWLNVGVLTKDDLEHFTPHIMGVIGSVETVNPRLRKSLCPGKPMEPIKSMFTQADNLGLRKGMTIILGLGETIEDIPVLMDFIKDHGISKIILYSLNPHKDTVFEDSPPPASLYQAGVIAALRLEFPDLEIVAGTWIDQLSNIGIICLAGANGITKYPIFRMYGNRFGMKVENEIRSAGRELKGTFTNLSILNGTHIQGKNNLGPDVETALIKYIERIKKS